MIGSLVGSRPALKGLQTLHGLLGAPVFFRGNRYQAFDASFDPEELEKARTWRKSFDSSKLPKGQTTFARSSGPGGQHVNKTETKAITVWPVGELLAILPRLMHPGIRTSKYYTARSNALTFQDQTHRSRTSNTDENVEKLFEEVDRIYQEAVPAETSPEKAKKHAKIAKAFNEARIKQKKLHSAKKQSRKGGYD
ncbi:peptidyl-tRNA hydrolase domain-containing protein [Plectosphaerella plurivora]|uniref:Peptidyl-tRNA hydrolase domain-containing protein n=1 Tax=Plectosphaerella plurivora TaxID=936078 RepID=A0A9P9ACE1_9PEZI|nr:peptidyl-tRNA hydrolase domain-containing protein [Plectosphaerella plurivora]